MHNGHHMGTTMADATAAKHDENMLLVHASLMLLLTGI